jgi:hypothetical protein
VRARGLNGESRQGSSRVAALLLAATAGCAFPQVTAPSNSTLVRDTKDPAQYRSALPRDVPTAPKKWEPVSGESCITSLAFPPNPPDTFLGSGTVVNEIYARTPLSPIDATFGNQGYARAVDRALRDAPGATLVDVRADIHSTSFLGILRFDCIEVHGIVGK